MTDLALVVLDNKTTSSPERLSQGELIEAMAIPGEDGLPAEIRLFKRGANDTTKGKFIFDDEAAKSVMARAEEYGNDYFFDYGHASLGSDVVDPARAGRSAGTYRLQVLNGELWTTGLKLTGEARTFLGDRQYRYVSPAFRHRDGHVVEFINAALTNMPATKHQSPIVLNRDGENSQPPEHKMEQLLAALGLSKNATEAEALTKLAILKSRGTDFAALTGKADVDEQFGILTAWKVQAEKLPEVTSKLEKLEAERKEEAVQKTVRLAMKAGVLAPAMKDQAIELGRKDHKFLKGFLAGIKPAVKDGKKEKAPDASAIGLTKEISEVATTLGLDPKKVAEMASKGMPKPSNDEDKE